jgi:hypothetical protein
VTKEITIEEITAALPIMIRASGWFYMEAAAVAGARVAQRPYGPGASHKCGNAM